MADKGKFSMPAFLSAGEKTAIRKKKYTEPGTLWYSLFKATEVNCYTANIYDQFTIRLQSFIVSQFPSTVIGSALPLVVL